MRHTSAHLAHTSPHLARTSAICLEGRYATPALLGALLFVLLSGDKYYAAAEPTSPVPLPAGAEYFVPWLFCLLLRAAAWTFRLALPHWARKRQSIFDLRGAPPPLEAQPSPRPIAPSLFPRAVPWTGSLSLEPQKPQFQVALTPAEGHNSIADRAGLAAASRLLQASASLLTIPWPTLGGPAAARAEAEAPLWPAAAAGAQGAAGAAEGAAAGRRVRLERGMHKSAPAVLSLGGK